MPRTIKIIVTCLFLLSACKNDHHKEQKVSTIKDSLLYSVNLRDSTYHVDSTAILSNHNLPFLINIIDTGRFTSFISKDSIPEFIWTFLDQVHHDKFKIANRNEVWNASGSEIPGIEVPDKRLLLGEINNKICILYFLQGGDIYSTKKVYIILFKNNVVMDFWYSNAPALHDKNEIVSFLKKIIS